MSEIPESILDALQLLREESAGCRGPYVGTDRVNTPEWQAGAAFAAIVHDLGEMDDYSYRSIARDLGITYAGLRNRLARHGYMDFPPSQRPKGTATPMAAHGTTGGYYRHVAQKDEICEDCRQAAREYWRDYERRHPGRQRRYYKMRTRGG